MQEKKFDKSQLIGFVLMAIMLAGYFWYTTPSAQEIETQRSEQITKDSLVAISNNTSTPSNTTKFAEASSVVDTIQYETISFENDVLDVEFSSKGAQISKVRLKNYKEYSESAKDHKEPLYIINDNNANLGLSFTDSEGRLVDFSKRSFKVKRINNDGKDIVVFSSTIGNGEVRYIYSIEDYTVNLSIESTNFNQISSEKNANFKFDLNAISQEKGKSWEERTTDIHFSLNDLSDHDYTASDFSADPDEALDWVAFKQQFFATIIEQPTKMKAVNMMVEKPVESDSAHSKFFTMAVPLEVKGELNEEFTFRFVPLEFDLLKAYDRDYEDIIPFGWAIFGWINEWIILPVFKFLASTGLQYGWVIALLTIFIKLITSPIMYKQYKQSAMMRVLRPDLDEIAAKYKDNKDAAMKKQQETMGLYRKAGVNPVAGCLPGLLQIPIFYALFNFFPNIIDLRGEGFLWAEDLTAYDSVMELPFTIPFYGDHVSLFALLYVITMIIYFKISGTAMSAPKQEGMPDMKYIMYVMPLFFIFFLNSYASGLSLYYFVSNAINIGVVLVIKNFMIDEDKIHAKIQENKLKPKKSKKSKWSMKLEQAMKQAQEQKDTKKLK